ncbi:helix-turn-helix transcriptional regulator [Streptomyces sp. H27-S2]|uniref:helix-turn-helix transcriptional regulator n=1 Tax=Streptomyces antarcticus TaxID=2996458 RepID=UPI00226EAF97|nr:LuxR C-terminal-related transcriptional regulator [Streptomyces sp. H27-S2]MCY0954269.1 LuxR C-terminal-related transcriptional regulator [Streptomyces sp. H27-S2]
MSTAQEHDTLLSDGLLTPQDVAVYRQLLERSPDADEAAERLGIPPERCAESIDRLTARRLLSPDGPYCHEALSPGLAALALTASAHVQVHELMRRIDSTRRELGPLGALYEGHLRRELEGTGTELLTDGEAVRHRLAELSAQVRHSVLTVHPTLGSPETLRAARELDRDLLARGVRYRTVLPHTARRQREALQHMKLLAGHGARVRTAAVVPGRLILLDEDTAVVPTGTGGAAVLRDPTVVTFLTVIFDHIWEHARPVEPGGSGGEDNEVFEDVEVAILRHLARGRSDDFIARKLGISTRTMRRYLAALCEKLDVETRFQLGMAAERLGLLEEPGEADRDG